MSSTLEASVFMGKNYSENLYSIKNTGKDLTLKQMFDISEKVDSRTIRWDLCRVSNQLGRFSMEMVNDEEVIILSHAKVYVFSDSVLCSGKVNQNPTSNTVWEEQLSWFKDSPQHRTLDTFDGEPMEFERNIFPGFTALQLVDKVQEFMNNMGDPAQFQVRIIFMSMFNDIIWGTTDKEQECIANATLVSLFATRCPAGRWSFLGLGSEKKWYSTCHERSRGEWDRVAELMMIKFGESGHPVFRAASPLSRGTLKSKGGGTLSIHFCADGDTIETVFHTIISVNQLSIYGAVSDLCEEYNACQTRTGRAVLAGQSDPSFEPGKLVITTHILSIEICTRKFIAKIQGTSGKAFTTRSSDEDLYWCRIPENSWSRTVLHDKGHWRVLTIYRTSDVSWVHVAKRWRNISRKVGFEGTPQLGPY